MKTKKAALAVGALGAAALLLKPAGPEPVPDPAERGGRILLRVKLENRDGELWVTPTQRRVHYINGRKVELEPKSVMIPRKAE